MPELISVAIDQLMADPTQPRKIFEADAIGRLATSIAARGIQIPLRVLRDDERSCWLIVTGESRYRAAKQAGLTQVPCLVVDGQPNETDLLADRIVENSCRSDLRPLDLARALARLKALKGCNSQTLAKELGISGASITRAEALLSLPEDIQALVDSGALPESTAYSLSRMPDEADQRTLAESVVAGRLNRQGVVDAVQTRLGKRNVRPKAGRLAIRLASGISVAVSGGQPWTWNSLMPVLERLYREAKKLSDNGKDITDLARSLRSP
jgi:ParB family chromosome partitioning protein